MDTLLLSGRKPAETASGSLFDRCCSARSSASRCCWTKAQVSKVTLNRLELQNITLRALIGLAACSQVVDCRRDWNHERTTAFHPAARVVRDALWRQSSARCHRTVRYDRERRNAALRASV